MFRALAARKTRTNVHVIADKDNYYQHFQQSVINEVTLSQLSQSRFEYRSFYCECMSLKSVAPPIQTVTFPFFQKDPDNKSA